MALSPQARSLLIKIAIGLLITGSLFYFLLRYLDPREVAALFAGARGSLLAAGLGFWVVIYVGRACRFVLLAPRTPFATMLAITAVHAFLLRLLPLRTGELAYAFLVRRAGSAGLGESLIALLLVRILDSTCVVILFAVALAFHQGTYLGDRQLGIAAASVAALLGAALVAALPTLLRAGLALSRGAARLLRLTARLGRLLDKGGEAVAAFARVRRGTVLAVAGLSMLLWLLTFGAFFAIMRAFLMPVDVAQTVLGSTAAVVTGFLPIGGIGSFGTLEAGWALGFALVGLDRTRAIASGFGVSITTFGYGAVLGLLGWIGLQALGRRPPPRGP
jgi:uncharacterized membrane protein YbhN (UPF0104 family)